MPSGTFSPGSAALTFRARSCERTPPRPMLPVSVILHCCVNVRARMTVLRPLIPPPRLVRVICCGNDPLSPLAGSRVFLHCHYPDVSAPQLALRWLIEPVWPGAAIGSLSCVRAKLLRSLPAYGMNNGTTRGGHGDLRLKSSGA
ncbi:uncharacterized protein LAESUDRAFT_334308 [Laetiporus sulphureus 93-53]|uniref:Uncharacterized protein n=1 Tax=Laetiporus sulphureus 93-53 TaxID=1314785 RepID=A0A165CVD1_9APHY|nr:uncharacterized protein LAESUDRAFT_334308 [Laetiporus sulphureus 93-53]KZT03496.1 hypothetical protein LAESUDRAFT_334308 [Laetiporus sulphureus 93-53]